jgi:carbon storage regulator
MGDRSRGFLVLTRYEGERILITTPQGEVVEIVVKRIKGAQVRVGVGAPRNFDIKRVEPDIEFENDEVPFS